jgi:hypothetical protein
MQENSENQIVLFVRDDRTGRHVLRQKRAIGDIRSQTSVNLRKNCRPKSAAFEWSLKLR